jgi:hypothetical protein
LHFTPRFQIPDAFHTTNFKRLSWSNHKRLSDTNHART